MNGIVELLESDERASQRYVLQIEELRDQLASEKEAACARERQLANESYVLLAVLTSFEQDPKFRLVASHVANCCS